MKRCVLVAAGPMRGVETLRALLRPDDYILCADGGADNARLLGCAPALVMGDFDSVRTLPPGVPVRRFAPQKDDTDTMLALKYALGQGYRSFLLLGAWGGRADHAFANLCALLFLAQQGADAVLADGDMQVRAVKNGTLTLARRPDCYVSVFPFDGAAHGVSETGMRYALRDAVLRSADPIGVSNEFQDETAVISVRDGALLVFLCKKK